MNASPGHLEATQVAGLAAPGGPEVVPIPATLQIAFAGAYFALYLGWARLCRTSLDVRARRWLGQLLGVRIVWVASQATGGRRAWLWGVVGSGSPEREGLVGAIALLLWWLAAVLPVAGMLAFVFLIEAVPNRVGHILMLFSLFLMAHFFAMLARGPQQ